ncbi:MAG: RsmF rRNA methyltransferase first C-terminal domain-containing protein [Lachnospiraceae bacterium]|nr:RsmF rRNA methyltransferase first C-terminal domain-containing protein [Lachnospiraceae bacterium]
MLKPEFVNRMKEMLKEEYPAFEKALLGEKSQGLRVNPLKGDVESFLEKAPWKLTPVPFEKTGFYYEEADAPGKHPYHDAGVYYIQEPSAMAPAMYLNVKKGDVVLDLCAAPGGKTTQIAGAMGNEGLLISNEIHPQRAKILSENVERMGVQNCLVMNETPQHLSQVFVEYFDKIVVDAPCSGEGMIRKNKEAMEQWSEENVMLCANRQDEILECAATMLKPGGRLVYSTCTFAQQEDEGSVQRFLEHHKEFHLTDVPLYEGMCRGMDKEQKTVRLFPHKFKGEGHFVAVLEKDEGEALQLCKTKTQESLKEKELTTYRSFEKEVFAVEKEGTFIKYKDELYVAPKEIPGLKGLKVLRPGLHLGTFVKNRFVPNHALALASKKEDLLEGASVELSSDSKELKGYLHGETFLADCSGGWKVIMSDDYSLGWGKVTGNTVKNHYPKGLRKMY